MAVGPRRGPLGLLGGVFDPPHVGHLALARGAFESLGLAHLLVLVNDDPGHKRTYAPPEVRLELTRLGFADLAGVEVEADPYARTVDLLEARPLPDDAYFVVGADELVDFPRWKEPARVLELARLAVATRPGVSDEELRAARARVPSPDRVSFFELEPVEVSSSEIRARVARGESISDLVTPGVAGAIARLRLYRDGE